MCEILTDGEEVTKSHGDLYAKSAASEGWGKTSHVKWVVTLAEETMTQVGEEGSTELNSRRDLTVAEK